MHLDVGSRLGPYEIVSRLGAGGMGEVFKARDSRLGRNVAIKILPPEFADDPQLKTRFEREAKAISQLNHPHICTLYDIGQADGTSYLVLELLEGETLERRIARGALPLAEVIRYGAQIAGALDRAHRAAIVHRDLKPGNVMITNSVAKLLDFGLARSTHLPVVTEEAPTAHQTITAERTTVGTLPYMAPEQLEGKDVDARTDLFALGAVLYEMITGRRAFSATSNASLIAQILEHQPPKPSTMQPITPAALEHVVMSCLEKDPDARFQCAADIVHELRWIGASGAEILPGAITPQRRGVFALAALAVVAAVVVAAILSYRAARRATAPAVAAFTQLTFDSGEEMQPALAPDGKMFAFVKRVDGQRDIFLQRVDGRSAINLTQDSPADNSEPAFSPDGNQIAFRSERDGGGIFVMGATGESVRRLTEKGYNPAWSPNGKQIVYAGEQTTEPRTVYGEENLYVVDIGTGATRLFYKGAAMQPSWSPHGHRVAFWAATQGGRRDLYTVDRTGQNLVAVMADDPIDWNPVWSPDGDYLYFSSERDGTMNVWRIAINEKSGQPAGQPEPVRTPSPNSGWISIARNGRQLIYQSTAYRGELLRLNFDPGTEAVTPEPTPVLSGSMEIRTSSQSPDGKWIAFTTSGQQEDVFVMAADGTGVRQLTNDVHRDRGISWWPDGSRITFYSNRDGRWNIWTIRPDGSGLTAVTAGGEGPLWPRVSRDQRRLAYVSNTGGRVTDLTGTFPLKAGDLLPGTPHGHFAPVSWSPDGKQLAGTSWGVTLSGLYVYSFADRQLRRLPAEPRFGCAFVDNRRIIFIDRNNYRIGIADVVTSKVRFVGALPASAAADFGTLSFSIDGRTILVYGTGVESDIWKMSLASDEDGS
ncbi:MAG TPA: protein kinase [Gemmatimonadaceae bacterium]|nr:protein kinase [Gemmatimonadaceae bacterium]